MMMTAEDQQQEAKRNQKSFVLADGCCNDMTYYISGGEGFIHNKIKRFIFKTSRSLLQSKHIISNIIVDYRGP